MQQSRNL